MSSLHRVPVLTDLLGYRAALAELPLSTRHADEVSGAVVVVSGAGTWWRRVRDAASLGAGAVVVAEPGYAPLEEVEALGGLDIPIVVSRARLRPDVVADALEGRRDSKVRAVALDAAADTSAAGAVLRDAVGWSRVLTGGRLQCRAARSNGRGASALLVGADVPCTLVLGLHADEATGDLLRITALGEVLSEICVDAAQGPTTVVTTSGAGRLEAPPRYETAERLALRRALAALRDVQPPSDLDDLAHDGRVAADILSQT